MMFRGIFCPLDPQTAGRSGVEESFEQLGQSMMEWYFVNIVDDNPQNMADDDGRRSQSTDFGAQN